MLTLLRRTALLLAFIFALGAVVQAGEDRYAAIAFSPSTGKYGIARGFASKAGAIEEAQLRCGRKDAVVRWCKNAWLVLARSEKTRTGYGYGFAWGRDARAARIEAREHCLEHNDEAEIVVSISAYQ